MSRTVATAILLIAVFLVPARGGRAIALAQPSPMKEYPHGGYATQRQGVGGDEYWMFTPEQPRPAQAPVIVFLHGWGGMDPYVYGAWIRHLVQRGNIVIYPRYQANIKTKFDEMTPGAIRAVQAAYQRLQAEGPVRPDPQHLAIVGHSMGGFVAANLAALASANGLPAPEALMIIAPGDGDGRMRRLGDRLRLVDMSAAPESMIILLITGDADTVVGDRGAAKIWRSLEHSPITNKAYVALSVDKKDSKDAVADHLAPLAVDETFAPEFSLYRSGVPDPDDASKPKGFFARRKEARNQRLIDRTRNRWAGDYKPDAIDFDGYWRLLDELLEVAFAKGASDSSRESAKKWIGGVDENRKPGAPRIIRRAQSTTRP